MKTFIINLDKEKQKRVHITNECKRLNLDFEIYNAVDGFNLSDTYLKENVFDYPNNYLTKGEIGCALSHINLYKKIVNEKLPYALIIEDDAILNNKLTQFISAFEKENIKQGFFLLTGDFTYIVNKEFKIGEFNTYPITDAIGATGYIITNQAAQKLLDFLLPIRYEADMFKIFKTNTNINIYAVLPHLISNNDKNKTASSLESDRSLLIKKRGAYRGKLFKKERNEFTYVLSKFFIKIFCKTEKYKDF